MDQLDDTAIEAYLDNDERPPMALTRRELREELIRRKTAETYRISLFVVEEAVALLVTKKRYDRAIVLQHAASIIEDKLAILSQVGCEHDKQGSPEGNIEHQQLAHGDTRIFHSIRNECSADNRNVLWSCNSTQCRSSNDDASFKYAYLKFCLHIALFCV